jgi:ribosomal protein S18 acetylase RimI-like enzyme
MSLAVRVRRATAADAGAVLQGINEVCAEREFFSTAHYVPSPQWEALLHRPHEVPDHLLYVAEHKGEIIGAAQILPYLDSSPPARSGELGIFVRAPFRSQGVGSQLLKPLLKDAEIYYNKIRLYTLSSNNRAISLFSKFGFGEVGRRRHHYAYLGDQEQLVMEVELPRKVSGGAVNERSPPHSRQQGQGC